MKADCQKVGDSQSSVSSSHWRKAQSESGLAKQCIPTLSTKFEDDCSGRFHQANESCMRTGRYGEEFETGHYASIAEIFSSLYNYVYTCN